MLRFKKSSIAHAASQPTPSVVRQWRPERAESLLQNIILHTATSSDDPVDIALCSYAKEEGATPATHPPMHILSADTTREMSGNLWHHGAEYKLYIKGKPDQVLARCDLTDNEHERALTEQHRLAASGVAILAFAHMTLPQAISSFDDLPKKVRFEFDGLVALKNATLS